MCNVLVSFLCVDALLSVVPGHTTPTQGDALFSDLRLVSLEKQLNIELKVMHTELFSLFKIPPSEGSVQSCFSKLQHVIKPNATHLHSKGMAPLHGY
jgi:hypothetical protein